jgi:YbbR domain-containing protein
VVVGVEAIEGSLSIQVPIEVVGLGSDLAAEVSPEIVDVLLSGPLPILEALEPGDIKIVVNVTELEEGTHLLAPEALNLPEGVTLDTIIPETIEIIITAVEATPTPAQP